MHTGNWANLPCYRHFHWFTLYTQFSDGRDISNSQKRVSLALTCWYFRDSRLLLRHKKNVMEENHRSNFLEMSVLHCNLRIVCSFSPFKVNKITLRHGVVFKWNQILSKGWACYECWTMLMMMIGWPNGTSWRRSEMLIESRRRDDDDVTS